jgi:hypothetical protein
MSRSKRHYAEPDPVSEAMNGYGLPESQLLPEPGVTVARQLRRAPLTWKTYAGALEHLNRLHHHWRLERGGDQVREYSLGGSSGLAVTLWLYTASDYNTWLRVQVAHPRRTPTWIELLTVARSFVGRRRSYLEISPPPERLSVQPHRLTIYANLDASPSGPQLPILPLEETWRTPYPGDADDGSPQSEWDWNAGHSDPAWP